MTTSKLFLPTLARAYVLSETRSPEDPELQEALEDVGEIQKASGWMVVRLEAGFFTVNGEPVSDMSPDTTGFLQVMNRVGIRELRVQGWPEPGLLEDLFRRIRAAQGADSTCAAEGFRGLGPTLGLSFKTSHANLPGMTGGIQTLFHGIAEGSWATVSTSSISEGESEGSAEAPADDGSGPTNFEPSGMESGGLGSGGAGAVPDPAFSGILPSGIPSELAEELEVYAGSEGVRKAESAQRLRQWAGNLREGREHLALTELICVLAEGGAGSVRDPEAVELAQELATPTVATLIVARLGVARPASERARLGRVIAGIGPEGAAALADALGESRDRGERRAFLDAMVTLGPQALGMARKMVEDPRWFVVRNGVTVLGEIGGDEAVALLTGTLANQDQRVRRETVKALAKIDGPDGEALLLGMLEDPAPGVRSAACRGLGGLQSQRAVKPLMARLNDKSVDVQVEAISALGLIRDPGAVQKIRKMASGGLLSRPPQEVRIAAFRALASIGTPGAMRVVEKATRDGDEAVRRVAEVLLHRH
jgi:HEAT repeat protein